MSMKVGLIAGDGNFPLEVAKSIYQQEKKVFIIDTRTKQHNKKHYFKNKYQKHVLFV